jgi:hypothetical protein
MAGAALVSPGVLGGFSGIGAESLDAFGERRLRDLVRRHTIEGV